MNFMRFLKAHTSQIWETRRYEHYLLTLENIIEEVEEQTNQLYERHINLQRIRNQQNAAIMEALIDSRKDINDNNVFDLDLKGTKETMENLIAEVKRFEHNCELLERFLEKRINKDQPQILEDISNSN